MTRIGIFTILFLIIGSTALLGQNTDKIHWYKWEEAYTKAKQENKMILVEIISDNCKFCLKMKKVTFIDPEIISLLNKDYIPVQINSDRPDEKFDVEGKEYTLDQMLAYLTNNSVLNGRPKMAFPTLVFIYPDDLTHYYETGYQDPTIFRYMLTNCVKEKERRDRKKKKKKK